MGAEEGGGDRQNKGEVMMQKADDRWANKKLGKEACRWCGKLYDSEELIRDGFCSAGCEVAHERAMFLSLLCEKCKEKVGEDERFFDCFARSARKRSEKMNGSLIRPWWRGGSVRTAWR
jgi:hypothetical protein